MNTRKLHHSNCLFSYNCVHHAFCYYVIFALLLLVTSLLHALCWNKDHITIYQFYSQLFQALAPVPREVKVVHRKSPTPNPKLQFRQQYGIAWLVYIQRNQLNMSTVWYYLARLYTKTSTKHEYSMVLPCSSIYRHQLNMNIVWYCLAHLYTKTPTEHEYSMVLPCSSIKKIHQLNMSTICYSGSSQGIRVHIPCLCSIFPEPKANGI
jgi:hypothetical protein